MNNMELTKDMLQSMIDKFNKSHEFIPFLDTNKKVIGKVTNVWIEDASLVYEVHLFDGKILRGTVS